VLRGGQPPALREALYTQIKKGKVKIVFATPEVLLNEKVFGRLKSLPLSQLVLDEAHCVSEWGESFRPAYLSLGEKIQHWDIPLITAFTATASSYVISRLQKIIFDMRPVQVVKDIPDRPNIFYKFIPALSKAKVLTELCQKEKKPLVIFSRSRTAVEQYAKLLNRRFPNMDIFFYHAGLDKEEREKIEKWFFTSDAGILVSTSAYGMGVDKADIRTVIHADVPPSVEAYLQESGRAGRDGKPARAFVLFSIKDLNFSDLLKEDFKKRRFLRILACISRPGRCRRQALLDCLGSKLEYCSGCDFCRKEVMEKPDEEDKILAFLRRWSRRFTLRESIQVLKGENSCEAQEKSLYLVQGFGILSAWEKEDINEALYSLWEAKKITIPRRGFFKHRIRIC
jgi:ATP-dependent DNA helicase RecQ